MSTELKKEFLSEVRIGDRLKAVDANSIANYSFVINYRHDFTDNSSIFFIDDEMNVVVAGSGKSIYDKVYIENVRNLSSQITTKIKCDEFNNILIGTHKAFFDKDKINYENRPNDKVDYYVVSTNVLGSTRISTKLAQLTRKICKTTIF